MIDLVQGPGPSVSVIILNWNKPKLTIKAAESVLEHTLIPFQLIIADNGSTPRNLKEIERFCQTRGVSLVDIGINRFFGEGNNVASEFANGDFVVFLNNDVSVTANWLPPMLRVIEGDESVGAVGPKFLYPNGVLQEAGAFLDSEARSVQLGKGLSASDPRFNFQREVDYVSAACILMRKADFERVLGFNFIYEPAYYEDTDLCFSLRSLGKRVIYQPESEVVHLESATTADPSTGLRLNNISEINREKFLARWGNGRRPGIEGIEGIEKGTSGNLREINGSTIAVYTPFHLTIGGGEKYLLTICDVLLAAGHSVALVTDFPHSALRIRQLGQAFGLSLAGLELLNRRDAVRDDFDVMIAMGNEVYPPIEMLGRKNVFHCQFPFPSINSESRSRKLLGAVDLVILNSEFTKSHYLERARRMGVSPSARVIYPPVDLKHAPLSNRQSKRILSVGRFFVGGHMKRQDVLIQAFRELSRSHPDATLDLVGGVLPGNEHRRYLDHCLGLAQGLNVNFHVDADSKVVDELLKSSSIYWHGAGFGVDPFSTPEACEHFGISVVEAMSAGLIPLVVGAGGPDEFVEFGVNGFKYHTIANLVRRTELLFNLGKTEIQTLRENSRDTARRFSVSAFASSWSELVENVLRD